MKEIQELDRYCRRWIVNRLNHRFKFDAETMEEIMFEGVWKVWESEEEIKNDIKERWNMEISEEKFQDLMNDRGVIKLYDALEEKYFYLIWSPLLL